MVLPKTKPKYMSSRLQVQTLLSLERMFLLLSIKNLKMKNFIEL